jgi:pyrroline-5-carboxylate reductase
MRLGFVGTGAITSAMVTGLRSSDTHVDSIQLSPRNLAIATDLSRRLPGVSIASSNQDVLDSSETVVIAVRPPVARRVLSELRFRFDHCIISVVSAMSLRSLSELTVPATRITRATPLPSTARRIGPTAIYPPDPTVVDLFSAIGTTFAVESEDQFEAMCAATATIASAYSLMEEIASWLSRTGVRKGDARDYVARMFWGLTGGAVDAPERAFKSLASEHATVGGINEQFLRHMVEHNLFEGVSRGLDAVLQRIREASHKS